MFSGHFKTILFDYHLLDSVMTTMDAFFIVVLHKILSGDQDRLERDFMKDDFLAPLFNSK